MTDVSTKLAESTLPSVGDWSQLRKFRELSGSKIQYLFPNAGSANHVTVTSTLPTPRKGNPGTLKTVVNVHCSVTLDAGLPTQRAVPIVAKMETSFPVGTAVEDQMQVVNTLRNLAFIAEGPSQDLFCVGILPE